MSKLDQYISDMCELTRQYAVLAWPRANEFGLHHQQLSVRADAVIAAMAERTEESTW